MKRNSKGVHKDMMQNAHKSVLWSRGCVPRADKLRNAWGDQEEIAATFYEGETAVKPEDFVWKKEDGPRSIGVAR